jgi:beta-glucosidase
MKTKSIVTLASISLIAGALIAGNVVAGFFAPMITTALCGTGVNFDSEEFQQATAQSDALCQEIAQEGIVLMKNQNNVLPLKFKDGEDKNINVFGWASSDNGFLLSGIGSGSSTISEAKKVTLLQALTDGGFHVNEDLVNFYHDYDSTNYGYNANRIKLIEPEMADYDAYYKSMLSYAEDFSDTALIVISRVNGENVGEIPMTQTKTKGQKNDSSRTYLELSTQEEELIDYCGDHFDKVIVLINSTNQMQLGKLDDPRVDAVLNVAIMGQSGTRAIPKILDGSINPSGHLIDTYAYDYKKEPSYINRFKTGNHIMYNEDMYFGYRWYETADAEHFFDDETRDGFDAEGNDKELKGYEATVQYPFGHGLSYTSFEWNVDSFKIINNEENKDVNATDNKITKDSKIELSLSCTNTGEYSGKDVIQLYYSAPYYQEIEKSAINLIDFAKSVELEPGKTQKDIKVTLDSYDMASYDCYDMNENDFAGYELEKGTYQLKLMENSHDAKKMKEGSANVLELTVENDIQFDKDTTTGEEVKNRFTDEDAYAGVPIDGSSIYSNDADKPVYLSRSDFEGTFPNKTFKNPTNSSAVSTANNYTNTSFNQSEMPVTSKEGKYFLKTREDGSKATLNDLKGSGEKTIYNEELIYKIGSDYDCQELSDMVDQLSIDEAFAIVEDSGFGTPAIESIGKARSYDFDGPAGFNTNTQTGISSGEWTAFPSETLVGQTFSKRLAKLMGQSVGLEGMATNLQGWYAPGVNMHRSPFNGRNYEYYSEDPVLNGYMASEVILGAKSKGLYCYIKHFTLSEPGDNARNLNTWLTEQNFREMYLKPFEIAVKKGGANAIMSAFNFVGGVWAGANAAMNVDILRNEWGFKGSMITDWSDGSGSMNTKKGVRAGNDIWLNPNSGHNASPLNNSDPTDVYCAKLAAKNVIYTFCDTYNYYKHYDTSLDNSKVIVGESQVTPPFAWWIPLLVGVDVLIVAGLGCWLYFGVIRKPKEK